MNLPAAPSLAEIIRDEAVLYEELLGVLIEEEAALVRGQSGVISEGLARKDTITVKLRLLELSRRATVTRLTGRSDTRLRDLPGADTGELGVARARLTAALDDVQCVSRRVDALLTRSLARLNGTLALLHDTMIGDREYTAAARLVGTTVQTLDRRA
jgi:flagellar biosynthesis/type III secretory pathway chaperone